MVTAPVAKIMYAIMDVFCIAIVVLMLTKNKRNGKLFKVHMFFNRTLTVLMAILIADFFTWTMNGLDGKFAYVMNFMSNEIYFCMIPLFSYRWHKYCEEKIGWKNVKKIKSYKILCVIPKISVILNLIVLAENFITQSTFYISKWNNLYHRGHFFYVCVALFFISTAATLIMTLASIDKTNEKEKRDRLYLAAFMIAPAICSILQFSYFGININFLACTFSMLMIFINVQTEQITVDYLTGVNNRRAFDLYLYGKAADGDVTTLFLMFVDIDHFKEINDRFGHLEGDDALAEVAAVLKKGCRKGDFLARMGGDEFSILGYAVGEKDIEARIRVINEELALYNENKNAEYKLTVSIGYAFYKKGEDKQTALRKLVDRADADMYRKRNTGRA